MSQTKTELVKAQNSKATAKESTVKPAQKKQPEKTEASIYIGPSLPGGKLNRTALFKGGKLPKHIEQLANECPAIKALIVPVSKLAAAEVKLSQTASVELARFKEIGKHFNKGAK